MAKHFVYKLCVAPIDKLCCPVCGIEKQVNDAALDGFELQDLDLKLHNGESCWIAIMFKEVRD